VVVAQSRDVKKTHLRTSRAASPIDQSLPRASQRERLLEVCPGVAVESHDASKTPPRILICRDSFDLRRQSEDLQVGTRS